MATIWTYLSNSGNFLLLAFGFGFVIFWHELGHFLAAKWADVKVEQFAVGFGQAMISWRKGLGVRWGSTQEDYQKRLRAHIETSSATVEFKEQIAPTEAQLSAAAAALNISETEYRLNWIPLGGYVKMLGQDDLKPGQTVSDPRSYNNKTIGARMVIVSAGVIMNVILAAIGFMYIFTVGFTVPTTTVGLVVPGSPAQNAYRILTDGTHVPFPLQVGDQIQSLNGRWQSDFEKIKLNTALSIAGDPVPIDVVHADGSYDHLFITPAKATPDSEFPQIGLAPYVTLTGEERTKIGAEIPDFDQVGPGDEIVAINGTPVGGNQYYKLDQALQAAAGKPVAVTIKQASGKTREDKLYPHFLEHFGQDSINFAGMQMPTKIVTIQNESPLAVGDPGKKIEPGDLVIDLAYSGGSAGHYPFPTLDMLVTTINKAGDQSPPTPLTLTVRRPDGKEISVTAKPTIYLEQSKRYGFGIQPAPDESTPIIAGVLPDSPAAMAKVQPGSQITAINGTPVSDWFDVKNILGKLKAGQDFDLTATIGGALQQYHLRGMTTSQVADIQSNQLITETASMLKSSEYARTAPNLLVAAKWGVAETRDAILQVYQTVRSMSKGNIKFKEVSGPLGILNAGYHVAERGTTRLVWFLSIISANLAVMNFLPIPVVDGGLFTFLIIEKLKGSPISPRVQSVAQAVGLALLLSVFVFATWQDVLRFR